MINVAFMHRAMHEKKKSYNVIGYHYAIMLHWNVLMELDLPIPLIHYPLIHVIKLWRQKPFYLSFRKV